MSDFDQLKIRRLDFTLLLVFSEAMRHRKLALVADRLGLSQPAISHAIGRLRDLFDDELFLRRPHGIEPTARARALEPIVRQMLERAQQAFAAPTPFDPAQAQRDIRIAAPDLEAALLGPRLTDRLSRKAPGLRVSFRQNFRADALQALSDGEIDLVIGYLKAAGKDYLSDVLLTQGFKVVARKGHPNIKSRLNLARYLACGHILVSLAGDFSGVVDDVLEQSGQRRQVAVTMPQFLPALATVAATDLIATVPARLAETYAAPFGLRLFEPPVAVRPFDISMVWHRRDRTDAALAWIREQLAAIAG